MKKVLVLAALVATATAYSQGLVNFNNKVGSVYLDAPISYAAGGPVAGGTLVASNATIHVMSGTADFNGTFARVAIYGGPAGAAEDSLQIITPSVGFRGPGTTAGYFPGGNRTLDAAKGGTPGQPARFQLRAWDTGGLTGIDSYELAVQQSQYYAGKSGLIDIAALGGGTFLTPNLGANTRGNDPLGSTTWGLQPFSLTYVPEPSIIGLGILGAITGLLVFRRRN